MERHSSDNAELLSHLAGVLIRLDRFEEYEKLVERVVEVGEGAVPVLTEILKLIDARETRRGRIRESALRALQAVVRQPLS